MTKRQVYSLLLLSTILLLPFASAISVVGAQVPSYLSVKEGDSIIWDVKLDRNNLDCAANDVTDALNEAYDYLGADPNGLEDFLEQYIPAEDLNKNFTTAICDFLYNLTDTLNLTIFPDQWLDKNISTVVSELINNTINMTMPGVFPEDFMDNLNMSAFISMLLDNLTAGNITNFTNLTFPEFIDLLLDAYVPTDLFPDGWRDVINVTTFIEELVANLTAEFNISTWLDFNVSQFILETLDNLTAGLMPVGWLQMNTSTLIYELLTASIITPEMVNTLNISQLIGAAIANLTADTMPAGWLDLPILDLFTALISDVFNESSGVDIISILFPLVLYYYLPYGYGLGPSLFLSYSIQDLLDSALSFMLEPPYFDYIFTTITAITSDFNFTITGPPIETGFISGYVNIYSFMGPVNYYTVINTANDYPNPGNITITVQGYGTNLTEDGNAAGDDVNIFLMVESPYDFDIPVASLITMGIQSLGSIQLSFGELLSTEPTLNITAVTGDYSFTVGADPSNNTWNGGIVLIQGNYGNYGIFPVTSVIDGGAYNLITIEAQPQNLTEMGFGVGNFTTFFDIGYRDFNLTSMTLEAIINMMFDIISSPFLNFSLPFLDTIEQALMILNSTFSPYMVPNFLNLTINELIEFLLMSNFYGFMIPIIEDLEIQTIVDGGYNFTLAPNPANSTWINKRVTFDYYWGSFYINNLVDNGTNIIIESPYNLTEDGVTPGSFVTIWRPFNASTDLIGDFFNLLPFANLTLAPSELISDLMVSITGPYSNYTIRDWIAMYFWAVNQSISFYNIPIGSIPHYTASVLEITSDTTFKVATDAAVFDCDNGGVYFGGILYRISDITLVDLGSNVSITVVPYYPLTMFGLPRTVSFYEELLDIDFAADSIHEIIHEWIHYYNLTLQPYVDDLNTFMGGTGPGTYDDFMTLIDSLGYFANNLGLKLTINSIGDEIETYPGGPKGVPINASLFFSPDMINWVEVPLPPGVTGSTFIVYDPSSIPGGILGALQMQVSSTFGLLMANTMDWSHINQEATIPAGGINLPGMTLFNNLKDLYYVVNWGTDGLLEKAEVWYGGSIAFKVNIHVELTDNDGEPDPFLFILTILLSIIGIVGAALVYVVVKKSKNR